jgi:hypothetical protein
MKPIIHPIRKFLLIICSLFWLSVVQAQNPYENILIMHNAVGQTESTVVIDVGISNYDAVLSFQFDVPLPPGFTYVAGSAVLNPARSVDHLIYAAVLPGTNTLRIFAFSLTNSHFTGNTGVVLSYTLNTPVQVGIYNLSFENPIMMGGSVGDWILSGVENGTVTITQNIQFLPGDANCNGLVNVMDVLSVINYIIGNNPQPFCFENADVNGDGLINVNDVVGTVNIILAY